ncbi:MAG: bifunctional diaminohydroxyphosphoribosylaminopyrimidine deaminase/5-amino-6-(5-phosphoribosylamino)uracil reductase RibD, partial [Campylobacterota bacterium]|nr:bifunctional diaminohydroxyphosphoribosylaminopyrimidine deaminase/5-amino-6-(5-phosphoribosylamino)uracil reductase RibD [Campylobacterota bacterium]
MNVTTDQHFMQEALNEAWRYQLLTYPNPAVGALIVKDAEAIACEAHKKSGEAHAEVNALRAAYLVQYPHCELKNIHDSNLVHQYLLQHHNGYFHDCTIYVTLEPCNHIGKTPSCAMLLKELRPKKIVVGSYDPNKEASGGMLTLKNQNIDLSIGILQDKCDDLLLPFKLWQKKQFIFFKMAMRLDGTIGGGKISSQQSLTWVHQLRTCIDVMLIGGNTVRTDRPTLDSRFVKGKAPNILIYSKQKEFDQRIPLFSIANRDVIISDTLEVVQDKNFVMVEGGYALLNSMQNAIDMLVLIVSNSEKKRITNKNLGLEE